MADIKIYGTLKNDTGEPIAYLDQVVDPESGKTGTQLIAEAGEDKNSYMTDADAEAMVAEIFGEPAAQADVEADEAE